MNFKLKDYFFKLFTLFLLAWGVLNLIQAWFTPLNNDEAYYWMYSKYLDWGYFDHPPMIALMIKTGYAILHNNLGVRLMIIASQIIALLIIWSLTNEEQRRKEGSLLFLILLIVISPVFNIFGFIATPDSPLILFSALFFLAYKRFIKAESLQNTILLGLSMAALMYSKYHGGLLILLVILSNPGILKRSGFYLASVLALILFLPHLYWQYSNGFPSFKYHLVERVSGFNAGNVPEYILNTLLIQNPLILPLCIWLIVKSKAKDEFEKALNFSLTGVLIFFLIASFRYRIQPQWTALICVPMLLILFDKLEFKSKPGGYIKWVAIFIFPVIIFARVALMIDFLPVKFLKQEFHNTKKWADEISKLAGDRPVVFTNSYQNASEYTFYTGKFAHSLDNLNYRKTQFDLWDFEEKVHGKEILYVPHYFNDYIRENFERHILPYGDSVYVKVFKDFQSLQKECVILNDDHYSFKKSGINTIHLRIFNPYPYRVNLRHKEFPVVFQIDFLKNGKREDKTNLELPNNISFINPGDTISLDCKFSLENIPPGKYSFAICSETGVLYDTYNSRFRNVNVSE
jgi:hypothetical protein